MTTHEERDYVGEQRQAEIEREERLHTRDVKHVMDRLRRALNIEHDRGEISPIIRKKLIMTPVDYYSRAWVKVNLVNLYRRYRQVRIHALTECIAIAANSKSQEETVEKIRKLIIEIGEAHRASKERDK